MDISDYIDSNTTLVKVKCPDCGFSFSEQNNSNTTLVKVKLGTFGNVVFETSKFKYNTC